METTKYKKLSLPTKKAVTTRPILEALTPASRMLAELKGAARGLPNPGILIDTLVLQEALASSEIENVVTTQDEAFRANPREDVGSPEAKEVARYSQAMRHGYERWREIGGISENVLVEMFRILKQRGDGYRTTGGTVLRNEQTGETVYEPPQEPQEIVSRMRELERLINEHDSYDADPLIKMALIHHQFESVHPFPDGNGRIGRILNVLYLTSVGLLDLPILYLSRAINDTKPDYYRLLQAVREQEAWEEWVLYLLRAVTVTAASTLQLLGKIDQLMRNTKHRMREELPKVYTQGLLNSLFRHPYTRVDYLADDISRGPQTASAYLKKLVAKGFLEEKKYGRRNYYINKPLVRLLLEVSADDARNAAAAPGAAGQKGAKAL